ncbi:MAG: hypothetical protein ABJ263_12255 [Tateyamaria sp.]|uniref:hypothetical protein n=1 Tax=Tateyamaria sp. TaxID=1929288 RepID=UPI003283DE1F
MNEVLGLWKSMSMARNDVPSIILATVLSRFKVSPVPGHNPEPVMILTLRPECGVWLTTKAV